jgi:prophage regulatory protein
MSDTATSNRDTRVADFIRARVREELRNIPEIPNDTDLLPSLITEAVLRAPAVSTLTALAIPTIYRKVAAGEFPKPIKLADKASGWPLSEIIAWIEQKKHERLSPPT